MKTNNKFCIVIPIYNEEPDITEKLSLQRLFKVIGNKNYDVYFVCPHCKDKAGTETYGVHFDTKPYFDLIGKTKCNVKEERFEDWYFTSTAAYSAMCLSDLFYKRFSNYEFMYIYQLDCYLLRDEFANFCELDFDYIGAPIIAENCGWKTEYKDGKLTPKVGNGGFSLRKISTFIDLLNPNGTFRTTYNISETTLHKVAFEDMFLCQFVPDKYDLKIADADTAYFFAWDLNADIMFKLGNEQYLPMAAHAWPKNIRFYKDVFEELIGNKEVEDYCEEKYKEDFKIYYKKQNENEEHN